MNVHGEEIRREERKEGGKSREMMRKKSRNGEGEKEEERERWERGRGEEQNKGQTNNQKKTTFDLLENDRIQRPYREHMCSVKGMCYVGLCRATYVLCRLHTSHVQWLSGLAMCCVL